MVYPIVVGRHAPPRFAEIAALTGGRSFHPRDEQAIDRALWILPPEETSPDSGTRQAKTIAKGPD
jgi:hypothetical protein